MSSSSSSYSRVVLPPAKIGFPIVCVRALIFRDLLTNPPFSFENKEKGRCEIYPLKDVFESLFSLYYKNNQDRKNPDVYTNPEK